METPEKRFPDLINLLKSWIPWRSEPASISKDFWMPDDSCRVCYECDSQFTLFNRRHHCRKCGRVFCSKCTSNFVPASSYDCENLQEEGELIRVCNFCLQQREDATAARNDAKPSSPTLSPSVSTTSVASTKSSGAGNSSISTAVSFTYSSRAYPQAPYGPAPSSSQSVQLETNSDKQDMVISENNMNSFVDKGDRSPTHFSFCLNRSDDDEDDYGACQWDSEVQRYHNSDEFYGPLEFDESEQQCGSNDVRPAEGNAVIQNNGIPAPDSSNSTSSLGVGKEEEQGIIDNVECDTSSSIYGVDTTDAEPMDFENNQQLWLPPEPEDEEDERETSIFEEEDDDATGEWRYLRTLNSFGSGEHRSRDRSSEENKKAMKNIVDGHFRALVAQLLQVENILFSEEDGKENWLDIITSLSWEAATLLKPDTSSGGGMDPGLYVKIKCLACGRRSDSMVVKGVVCKKNVANRRMLSKIEKPRFLVLGGALEYQRVTNLLSSFDTLLQQEMDHLKMAVAKIDAHHPNVLLVEKSVSRYAQDYLLTKNISLVLNIKMPLLERIARCTGAQVVPSIDHLSSPKLGHCDLFHVEKFLEEHGSAGQGEKKLIKTMMFFEGCPKPLGCTILLKGSSGGELKKVKHVLQYGVFAAYHLALETCFLADEGVSLPEFLLTSPLTVTLPSTVNSAISMIPGYVISSSEKSPSSGDLQILGKSDSNEGIANFSETGIVALPVPSEDSASQALKSISTDAAVDMHDLHIDNENQMSKIDERQSMSLFIPLSCSGRAPSSFFDSSCHTDEDNQVDFPKQDGTSCGENSNSTTLHHPVLSSSCLDSKETFAGGRRMDVNIQMDDTKTIDTQYGFSDIGTTHQDDPRNDSKEEFQPSSSDHQSILVSLSSRCVWKGTVCERSHLFRFKYYGSFDRPLGRYLRYHLFDQSYRCRSCEMPSEAHIYCYTHRQGSLTISVRKLQDVHLPGERDGKIWMWHRCLRCPRSNGLPPATRRVVMSDAAWGLSFGKFLELSFSNHAAASRVASCGHSLHRDCLRFYGSGEMVACFRYAPINVHSVYLPPSMLDFNYQHQEWTQEEADKLKAIACNLFSQAQKSLHQLEEKMSNAGSLDDNVKVHESRKSIIELEGILLKERREFEEAFQAVTKKEEMKAQPLIDILEVNKLQKQLLLQSYIWDIRIRLAAGSFNNASELFNCLMTRNKEDIAPKAQRSFTNLESSVSTTVEPLNLSGIKDEPDKYKQPTSIHQKPDLGQHDKNNKILCNSVIANDQFNLKDSDLGVRRVLSDGQFPITADLSDTLDAKWRGENGPTLVDANKFKSVSLDDAEFVLPAAENFEESTHKDLNSIFASKMPARSGDCAEDLSILMKTSFSDIYASLNRNLDSVLSEYQPEYILLFKELMQKGWARLLLPNGVYDIVIPIYGDEPTSAIAYALVCADYHYQISDEPEKLSREFSFPLPSHDSGSSSIFQSLEDIAFESFRSFSSLDDIASSITSSKSSLDPLATTKSMHVRVSFAVRYNVTCYYAKQFDALRRTCCPSEIDFIRSLSRCKKWGAQGGKSNVFFAKSLDDRFIIKQVTKTELESFIKFASEYFKYLLESIRTGSPTCLAKILGIYQVTIKSSKGGKETRMDVLVMENLLFGRSVKWLYDLKGSSRSRYNADSSGNNKVLLDQNLIEAMPTSPIFVGNKAKRLLERAVWNDTAFLASIDVMDYSLLVGVDENKHELVLGIIDFMRQYTWDKHLETWVKASGILGGPKDASPTVISPKQYKKRFRKAMSAYFLVVPDQWSPPSIIPSKSQSDLGPLGQDNQLGTSLNS